VRSAVLGEVQVLLPCDPEEERMPPDPTFQPDLTTAALFAQGRTALDGGEEMVLLDFALLGSEPTPAAQKSYCPGGAVELTTFLILDSRLPPC
jgi:hypothetical protein